MNTPYSYDGMMMATFGERLHELRKHRNISQEELAELLDVSRQSISKWENDRAYPEMTRLLFMSDYFDVSLDYLMRGIDTSAPSDTAVAYHTKDLLVVWNSFISNLSTRQRKLMMLLYILTICVFAAIIMAFLYGSGYAIGQFIGHISG